MVYNYHFAWIEWHILSAFVCARVTLGYTTPNTECVITVNLPYIWKSRSVNKNLVNCNSFGKNFQSVYKSDATFNGSDHSIKDAIKLTTDFFIRQHLWNENKMAKVLFVVLSLCVISVHCGMSPVSHFFNHFLAMQLIMIFVLGNEQPSGENEEYGAKSMPIEF